jgi:magnesium chelatase family protein
VIYITNIKISELFENEVKIDSKTMRSRVLQAREVQQKRAIAAGVSDLYLNGKAKGKYINDQTQLKIESKEFFQKMVAHSDISTRGCHKILRVARTIADMENSADIQKHHLAEALQYRLLGLESRWLNIF